MFGKKNRENKHIPKDSLSKNDYDSILISTDLAENLINLQKIYKDSPDTIFRTFFSSDDRSFLLVYIDGLSDIKEINENVLGPIMKSEAQEVTNFTEFMKKKLPVSDFIIIYTYDDAIKEICCGNAIILVDGQAIGFTVKLAKWEIRSIDEPQAEIVIKGPREGFTESIAVNKSLIFRYIKSPLLKMKQFSIGRYTQTAVAVFYIEGLANDTLITEVSNRIKKLDIDGIIGSNTLSEFIEDTPYTLFSQLRSTERVDVIISSLLEGRVAILTDGTPIHLVAPTTLYASLQSPEDYYQRFTFATAMRWLRYLFLLVALLLPSLYVAALTFHQEMIPTTLLLSIAATRELLPFPALIEALLMETMFDALREAGARLPKQVGAAVSIVGALVIGEMAVSAGIVSSPMVMIVAITGIASFILPGIDVPGALRLLRYPMIFLAGSLGFLGIMLGLIIIIIHLCTLRSFGVPFLTPNAPMNLRELKDVLLRVPAWKLNTRPHFTGDYNEHRQSSNLRPDPKKGGE